MQRCTRIHTVIRHLTRRAAAERGQVLVEFAIVLPVLIMIIMGIVYFGRYEDYNNQLTQLAEEGARWAAVDYAPSSGTLQSYVVAQGQPELASGSADVSQAQAYVYLPSGSSYATGQPIRVCVVSTVRYPALITTMTSTLVQAATMRIEQVNQVNGTPTNPYSAGNSGSIPAACPQT
jgi:Flp pilus assembly protein TadG